MQKKIQKKLTIALLLDDTFDVNDGVQQYIRTLGSWLANRGHEVHYVVGHSQDTAKNIHSMSKLATARFNGNTVRTPLPAKSSSIETLLRAHNFDVLHVQMPYSPLMAHHVMVSQLHTAAIIGTFHIVPYGNRERWATKLLGVTLRRSIKKIDRVLAVSAPAASLAAEAFGRQAEIVPNTVDIEKFTKTRDKQLLPRNCTNIVFLGRLVARKGCLHLLKAIAELSRKNKVQSVHVTICGDGPDRLRLENYATENNLTNIVTFVGFIAEEDKPIYLRDADIAVFPSTSGESFGIVLIEAMAAGSSVVLAGDNPGYRSVMHGLENQLFDPVDTKTFAALLSKHINDSSTRKHIQAKQKDHVKQFDTNTVCALIETIYYEAIAKKQILQDNTSNGTAKN